jgi:hypothetical protein
MAGSNSRCAGDRPCPAFRRHQMLQPVFRRSWTQSQYCEGHWVIAVQSAQTDGFKYSRLRASTSLPGNRSLLADTGLILGARPTNTRRVQAHYPAAARNSPQTGNSGVISPGPVIAGNVTGVEHKPAPQISAICYISQQTRQPRLRQFDAAAVAPKTILNHKQASPIPDSSYAHTRTLQTPIYPARPAG